jgi:hypothetical protein
MWTQKYRMVTSRTSKSSVQSLPIMGCASEPDTFQVAQIMRDAICVYRIVSAADVLPSDTNQNAEFHGME